MRLHDRNGAAVLRGDGEPLGPITSTCIPLPRPPTTFRPGPLQPAVRLNPARRRSRGESPAGRSRGEGVVSEIQGMGLPGAVAGLQTPLQVNDLMFLGYFESIEKGSASDRVTLGFGSGAAELRTAVEAYQMTKDGPRQLGSGRGTASGGKTPGLIVPAVVVVATEIRSASSRGRGEGARGDGWEGYDRGNGQEHRQNHRRATTAEISGAGLDPLVARLLGWPSHERHVNLRVTNLFPEPLRRRYPTVRTRDARRSRGDDMLGKNEWQLEAAAFRFRVS